jgi:predicted cupin superfamily sugar epimerase
VAAALDLAQLPLEGGLFRRTHLTEAMSAILFLLADGEFSAMHRLAADEIYFHHAGSPLRLLLIDPDGVHREVTVGADPAAGGVPQFLVPANWWQGSSAEGSWSLVSTVVTPAFDWSLFELGVRAELIERCPAAADRITELTRAP